MSILTSYVYRVGTNKIQEIIFIINSKIKHNEIMNLLTD